MSVAWSAYRAVAPVLGAAAPAARLFAAPAERALWAERLGRLPAAAHPADAWIHAASLGEALAAGPLARELARLDPRARFHLTATTRGGRARLAALDAPHSLAPVDAPQAVGRFLAAVRPRRLFLIETELWPHWLIAARAARIPVAVVSARLSERSVRRYRWLGGPFRALVGALGAVLCQTDADVARWLALGAPRERTEVTGNLKTDALPDPAPDRARARADLRLDPARPLLVLGNLRPGEGGILARAWRALPDGLRARWQVVAVPRHPQAAAEIRDETARAGQELVEDGAPRAGAWRWDATLGVLARYYAAAEVAVVGGTLAPFGGHNPLEPAACGAAVIVGPHHGAQEEAVATLRGAGGAALVAGEGELRATLGRLLGDDAARATAAAAALAVVAASRGAARRTAARLTTLGLWPAS